MAPSQADWGQDMKFAKGGSRLEVVPWPANQELVSCKASQLCFLPFSPAFFCDELLGNVVLILVSSAFVQPQVQKQQLEPAAVLLCLLSLR